MSGGPEHESALRQLETIVLTQVRDSMALMNSNMVKMNDKLDLVRDDVIKIGAADFAGQIERLETKYDAEILRLWAAHGDHGARMTAQAVQLARIGLGMAISASIGSLALGALIVVIVTKIFGAH